MFSEKLVLELVGLIYDAAGNPERWAAFLERFADAVKGATTHIVLYDVDRQNGNVAAAAIRLDPEAQRKYEQHYSRLDNWAIHGKQLLITGNVLTGQMLCNDRLLEHSEFYSDFLRPIDLFHEFCGVICSEQSVASIICSLRAKRKGPFNEDETKLLRALMPHLQRSLALHRRIVGLENRAQSSVDILDRLPIGLVLVSANGKVLMVNRQARAIIGQNDGFGINRERLCAKRHADTTRLQQLIQQAAATALGKGMHSGGVMMIARPSLCRPFEVLITPLKLHTVWLGVEQPTAAVFISDPENKTESPHEFLGRLFGLTPAEARLAGKLMQGANLSHAAEELGVGRSTVHSQLQRIFEKTGTNRQSELVRLLLRSPVQLQFGGDSVAHQLEAG